MSVMQELGHKHLSVLKIDAEGAEYAFLEEAFDKFGCLPVDQVPPPLSQELQCQPRGNCRESVRREMKIKRFGHKVADQTVIPVEQLCSVLD